MSKQLHLTCFLHVPSTFRGDFAAVHPLEIQLGNTDVSSYLHNICLGEVKVTVDLTSLSPVKLAQVRDDLQARVQLAERELREAVEKLEAVARAEKELGNA